jgi:hypothetical protein
MLMLFILGVALGALVGWCGAGIVSGHPRADT